MSIELGFDLLPEKGDSLALPWSRHSSILEQEGWQYDILGTYLRTQQHGYNTQVDGPTTVHAAKGIIVHIYKNRCLQLYIIAEHRSTKSWTQRLSMDLGKPFASHDRHLSERPPTAMIVYHDLRAPT